VVSTILFSILTPMVVRYFSEAKMEKLVNIGYIKPFTSLEDGVTDYVQNDE